MSREGAGLPPSPHVGRAAAADVADISRASDGLRLLFGVLLIFALFHWSALALASDRGQAGLRVGAIVLVATMVFERLAFGPTHAAGSMGTRLGLGRPARRGLVASVVVGVLLLMVIPLWSGATGTPIALRPDAAALVPGLFAQAGVAEETLFRGFLFGRLRRGRTFWRAAWLSALPFVAAHLILLFTLPWPIALASIALAIVLSFPLARLYDLGGGTIWGPAILHAVIQGAVKVIVIPDAASAAFPIAWIAASAVVPMAVFLFGVPEDGGRGGR